MARARSGAAPFSIPDSIIPGPSSGLARQIELGADADLFLSADQASADFLASRGLVARRRNLLTNRLVVIVLSEWQIPALYVSHDVGEVRRIAQHAVEIESGRVRGGDGG